MRPRYLAHVAVVAVLLVTVVAEVLSPMTRPWIKLYGTLLVDKADYPHPLWRAYVHLLLRGAEQPTPGVFRSRAVARVSLDNLARYLPELETRGDVEQHADGALAIAHWQRYQGSSSSAERQRRYRARQANPNGDASPVTSSGASPVTSLEVDRDIEVEGTLRNEARDVSETYEPRPTTFMGYRPKKVKPGEHAGQHGRSCPVCKAMLNAPERPWETEVRGIHAGKPEPST